MSLRRLHSQKTPLKVSFEFFPPRTPVMEEQLWRAIRRLEPLGPAFVSVTYGAGGSTRDRTHATVKRIVEETNLVPAAHLTCVAATRAEVDEVVRNYWSAGVRHIVALRGDMPEQGAPYCAHPGGYQSTPELVSAIRGIAPFEISVGTYPEGHPDSASLDADIDLLKKKIDARRHARHRAICLRYRSDRPLPGSCGGKGRFHSSGAGSDAEHEFQRCPAHVGALRCDHPGLARAAL